MEGSGATRRSLLGSTQQTLPQTRPGATASPQIENTFYSRIKDTESTPEQPGAIQIDSRDEDWIFHYIAGHGSYWTRSITRSGKIQYQYGINEDYRISSTNKPDFSFTCKMMPKQGTSEERIRRLCALTAQVMRAHRGIRYHRCCCDFSTLRDHRNCWKAFFGVKRRFSAYLVRRTMKDHDSVCACGCFEAEMVEDRDWP